METLREGCRRFGQSFSELFKLILFAGCAIFILVEVFNLIDLLRNSKSAGIIGLKVDNNDYAFSIAVLLIGLLGCYGALTSHKTSLRFFAAALGVSAVIIFFHLCTHYNSEAISERNDNLFRTLKNYMPDYNWHHSSKIEPKLEPTEKWDTIQERYKCCGIRSPKDWDSYQPPSLRRISFPGSCCSPSFPSHKGYDKGVCKEEEVFKIGCRTQVESIETREIFLASFFIALHLLLIASTLFYASRCNAPETSATTSQA